MGSCTLALDPTAVRTALDACVAILQQPDSGANLARGVLVVSVFGLAVIGVVAAFLRTVTR